MKKKHKAFNIDMTVKFDIFAADIDSDICSGQNIDAKPIIGVEDELLVFSATYSDLGYYYHNECSVAYEAKYIPPKEQR